MTDLSEAEQAQLGHLLPHLANLTDDPGQAEHLLALSARQELAPDELVFVIGAAAFYWTANRSAAVETPPTGEQTLVEQILGAAGNQGWRDKIDLAMVQDARQQAALAAGNLLRLLSGEPPARVFGRPDAPVAWPAAYLRSPADLDFSAIGPARGDRSK